MGRSSRAWWVRRDEAMQSIGIASRIISGNLAGIVDAKGKRVDTPWRIDARILPVAVNKSVLWIYWSDNSR